METQKQIQFFFFPLLAKGHMIPMVHLARLLAKRGVRTAVVTTPGNVRYLDSDVDDSVQIITIPFPDVGLPPGCENGSDLTSEMGMEGPKMLCEALTLLRHPFDDLLRDRRPDCVVSDWALIWPAASAKSLGVPHVTFRGSCALTAGVNEHVSAAEARGSTVDPLAGLPHRLLLIQESELHSNQERNRKFTDLADSAERNSLGIIIDTCRELEGEYVQLLEKSRRVWCPGPLHLQNYKINNSHDNWGRSEGIKKWLDSKDPESVLYVCFGSEYLIGHDQLREIAAGLESSGQPFIFVARISPGGGSAKARDWLPEGFEEKVGERGLVVTEWAPQVSILNHPSTGGCMSHAGWGSALETVVAGLPMIVWPLCNDQFFNERLFVDVLRVGVRVLEGDMRIMDPDKKKLVSRKKVKEAAARLFSISEEAEELRKKAKEYGRLARSAFEQGGSSYNDMTCLINQITLLAQAKKRSNPNMM